ncbi:hypothetical protein HYV50_00250 [Candidatus Pacearchaeota archaeon]|nr:hypothetical protein [Candidatus Pacearchaeota archaeon]
MKKPIFVIEHLEQKIWKWCFFEYKNISKIVGKENVWFTNLKRGTGILRKYGKVIRKSVREFDLEKVCVLDPEAKKTLTPKEANKFDYFVFGGILGDYPSRKRTKKELTKFIKNARARSIGKEQLATDNAVYVVNEIVKGKKIGDLKFKNGVEIRINKIESTILPYKYALVKGKPLVSRDLVRYFKK